MSEQKEAPEEQPDSGNDSKEVAIDPADDRDSAAPAGKDRSATRRTGNAVAWLALLLALVAVGVAGWQAWLARTGDPIAGIGPRLDEQQAAIDAAGQRIDALAGRIETVERRLNEVTDRFEARDFDPASLRRAISDRSDAEAALRQQVSALSDRFDQALSDIESRLARVGADRSEHIEATLADARFRLALAEVAGLLRLGQSRAELAGDTLGAVTVYRQVQTRLRQLDDGRLERLRQLVARELEALRAVETIDWSSLAGRLSALEMDSAQWPLAGLRTRDVDAPAAGEASGEEAGWWSGLRRSLGTLVRVTPRESAPLAPAAVESVRERLRLHLASAQAAVARRNIDELSRHLENAETLIRRHFDTAAEVVASALATLSEAASLEPPPLPDLGRALAEAERRLAAS